MAVIASTPRRVPAKRASARADPQPVIPVERPALPPGVGPQEWFDLLEDAKTKPEADRKAFVMEALGLTADDHLHPGNDPRKNCAYCRGQFLSTARYEAHLPCPAQDTYTGSGARFAPAEAKRQATRDRYGSTRADNGLYEPGKLETPRHFTDAPS